ncbi:MAG: valine--tRNA ligase [Crocinitomicaceae bacterium]|nr:valine--tRNA ligase [Crocinitomicaceae bacterium]
MSEISSKFNPVEAEAKWYKYWQDKSYFSSTPDEREPFTILIPPPNVTGVLHMGHMLNNTIQDVLIRKARMEGKNALWVPGTDHASIATEAKVVAKLKAEGIEKADLTREEFMKHAWEWTEKHGGIILSQLKRLGASCDWDREVFTMDEPRSESVMKVFVDLYNKGKIYRGYRMVNWDPDAKTTVSDEEVIHKDVNAKLYYVQYQIEGEDEFVTIATTRPETILGDSAICINPNDERFTHLKGKKVIVPIANRSIPIIEDDYVDIEFGTGCLKITPAHDVNDKEIGDRHQLEVIDVLNDDGTLNAHGLHYEGQDRFAVRKSIAKELEEKGFLVKIEDYNTSVGTSERTGAVIEPKLSQQWFLSMKEISEPALKAVMEDVVKLVPEKFKNTYRHWMENVRDWCISRQLYWGHRIPAWYFGDGQEDYVVAENENAALQLAQEKSGNAALTLAGIHQDEDALDTWFSSWLWPISVFDGIRNPESEELNYYYPSNVLVTAPEILFFWVARMIIAGYEYKGDKPFDTVYLTGIVRDKQGRKMSKSLGNSPDPIGLIEQYGADGVRVGMLLTSPAGNDLPFDESLCEQGSKFSNKIWNALRLIKGWEVDGSIEQSPAAAKANAWFTNRFSEALAEIEDLFSKFRLSEALMTTYKLVWDDFCSWYLEMIKPEYQKPIDAKTIEEATAHFENIAKLLHPFMPFITEEIWHALRNRTEGDDIIVAQWPEKITVDAQLLVDFNAAVNVITEVRTFRKQQNVPNKEALKLIVKAEANNTAFDVVVEKLCNLEALEYTNEKPESAYTFVANNTEYFIPLEGTIDVEAEKQKIQEELEYTKGFLNTVMKKLSNERFVNNAPEQVVAIEQKKKADAEEKIKVLEEKLSAL